MIYSTGGVERYIEHKQEVVTMLLLDQKPTKTNGKGEKGRKDLQRAVSYRSFKIIEGDCEEEEEEEHSSSDR